MHFTMLDLFVVGI